MRIQQRAPPALCRKNVLIDPGLIMIPVVKVPRRHLPRFLSPSTGTVISSLHSTTSFIFGTSCLELPWLQPEFSGSMLWRLIKGESVAPATIPYHWWHPSKKYRVILYCKNASNKNIRIDSDMHYKLHRPSDLTVISIQKNSGLHIKKSRTKNKRTSSHSDGRPISRYHTHG